MDEQENPPTTPRDRSTSPSVNSLLYGDHKRQPHRPHSTEPVGSINTTQSFSPIKLSQNDLNSISASSPIPTASTVTTSSPVNNNNNNNTDTQESSDTVHTHTAEPPSGGQQNHHENTLHIANFTSDLVNSNEDCIKQPIAKKVKLDLDKTCISENSVTVGLVTSPSSYAFSEVTSESNHISSVALSIGSVNSMRTVNSNDTSLKSGSEASALTTAEPVAQ